MVVSGITPNNIEKLKKNQIFVFGSNLAGRHGSGTASTAYKQFGAKYGRSHGMDGNCYGIPTKDENLNTLSIAQIQKYVNNLLEDVKSHPDKQFLITEIGCGLAGYYPHEIASLFVEFKKYPNVSLPESFIVL